MMYNKCYGILFTFNPTMQCLLGRFDGWQTVMDVWATSKQLDFNDKVAFNYKSSSQFNELVKYIYTEEA